MGWSYFDKKKKEFVALRMPTYLLTKLEDEAREQGTSLSEVIRRKLEEENNNGKMQTACL